MRIAAILPGIMLVGTLVLLAGAAAPGKPEAVPAKPTTLAAKPAAPAAKPTTPAAKPTTPVAKPTTPAAKPTTPAAKPTTPAAKPVAQENQCLACHSESDLWEGERRRLYVAEKDIAADIHWQKGMRCVDCHGGDPTTTDFAAAHSPDAKFRAVKSPKDVPQFCGGCHADIDYMRHYTPSPRCDQLSEYWTSGHGRRLKASGDPQVATCISCHGGKHGIKAVNSLESPVYRTHIAQTCATCHSNEKIMAGRMYEGRPLGHEQYQQWRQSVHGKALLDKGDLSAATCNNCHGNHGAMPPGVDSVANACGACHGKIATLFAGTVMKHRFEKVGLPGCATCHFDNGTHLIRLPSDTMLGMEGQAVCMKCHAQKKYGATLAGAAAARTMRADFDRLNQLIVDATAKLDQAGRLGMEVSQPRFDLRKVLSAQTNARTMIHSFALKPVEEALSEGFRTGAQIDQKADAILHEYSARRVWLAASLVPILIVVILLLLYIRVLGVPASGGGEKPPEQ